MTGLGSVWRLDIIVRFPSGPLLERTQRELNGVSCISIDALPAKQQNIVSRSFGQRVTQLQEMHQAVCPVR